MYFASTCLSYTSQKCCWIFIFFRGTFNNILLHRYHNLCREKLPKPPWEGFGKNHCRDYLWKEVYPQCASLTWGLTLCYEMLRSYEESYIHMWILCNRDTKVSPIWSNKKYIIVISYLYWLIHILDDKINYWNELNQSCLFSSTFTFILTFNFTSEKANLRFLEFLLCAHKLLFSLNTFF